MKIRKIANAWVLALSLLGGVACTQQNATEEANQTTSTKITDKAYLCPMQCEGSASNQAGKCAVCGMDLEKNPDYVGGSSMPVSASADTTQPGLAQDTLQKK